MPKRAHKNTHANTIHIRMTMCTEIFPRRGGVVPPPGVVYLAPCSLAACGGTVAAAATSHRSPVTGKSGARQRARTPTTHLHNYCDVGTVHRDFCATRRGVPDFLSSSWHPAPVALWPQLPRHTHQPPLENQAHGSARAHQPRTVTTTVMLAPCTDVLRDSAARVQRTRRWPPAAAVRV